jgi:hypothetical protein
MHIALLKSIMQELKQIFQLAPNHSSLLMPINIQEKNERVAVCSRIITVKGKPTVVGTATVDGVKYNRVITQFVGSELVETLKNGARYAPLLGYLNSTDHLPIELYQYQSEAFPCPPDTRISILVSDEDLQTLEEEAGKGSLSDRANGFQSGFQNTWMVRFEMNRCQEVTLLAPSKRDSNGDVDGFRLVPSILLTEPVELKPGKTIMPASRFGDPTPITRLTHEETTHPLVSHLLQLLTEEREYGFEKSNEYGSRALSSPIVNENFQSPVNRTVRTESPSVPTNFMEDESEVTTSTQVTKRSNAPAVPVLQ